MPIQPKGFDLAFREMEIDFTSRGRCNWENYFKLLTLTPDCDRSAMICIQLKFVRKIRIFIFLLTDLRMFAIACHSTETGWVGRMARSGSDALLEIGRLLKDTRKGQQLTQEQVADMAGISRPRYREIEAGSSAARTTTLINIGRALGLELMLIPQAMVPAVDALLRPHDDLDDLPAFMARTDGDENA